MAGLARLGITYPQPNVTQAVRVDLAGNGSDEVLLAVSRVAEPGTPARPVDYSVVLLRRVVEGSVDVVSVDRSIPDPTVTDVQFVDSVSVGAVADLNGDGRMEAIIERAQYEGRTAYAYEFDSTGGITAVLGAGCGA